MSIKKQYLKSKPLCKVTFSIDAELINGGKEVAVLGEFNDWNPKEGTMRKLKDGYSPRPSNLLRVTIINSVT